MNEGKNNADHDGRYEAAAVIAGTSEKNERKITCYNLIQCGAGFDYIFATECDSISID